MRNKVAKLLRKAVYGDMSNKSSARKYYNVRPFRADNYRRTFQLFKKQWNMFNHKQKVEAMRAAFKIQTSDGNVPQSTT